MERGIANDVEPGISVLPALQEGVKTLGDETGGCCPRNGTTRFRVIKEKHICPTEVLNDANLGIGQIPLPLFLVVCINGLGYLPIASKVADRCRHIGSGGPMKFEHLGMKVLPDELAYFMSNGFRI